MKEAFIHPELGKGEVFMGNIAPVLTVDKPTHCTSIRIGKKAYDQQGHPVFGQVPLFGILVGTKFYCLVDTKTNKMLKLSFNSTDINEVREDIVLRISMDNINIDNDTMERLNELSGLRVETSEKPFVFSDSPISEYLVPVTHEKEKYVPKGLRPAHVSGIYCEHVK